MEIYDDLTICGRVEVLRRNLDDEVFQAHFRCFHVPQMEPPYLPLLFKEVTYQAPNLGSSIHHVSVPGSVPDTHNLNKIDIKNHTFIANGENTLQGSGNIVWAIGLISYIRVLRQWSYDNVAPFLQATWSADITLDLFLKRTHISQSS
jgi:hypothetical protein